MLLVELGAADTAPMVLGDDEATQRIFDYFASEIFDRCDAAMRGFLLRAALPPSFGEAGVFARLGRERFFVERSGGGAHHRFHPLFRAFLRARAARELPPEELREELRRAGARLLEERRSDEAFDLLREADDAPGCAALVRAHAGELLAQGRAEQVARWIAALPPELVDGDGWLLYFLGLCRLGPSPAEALALLARAAARHRADGERRGELLATLDAARAVVLLGDDFRALDGLIADATRLLAGGEAPGPSALHATGGMLTALAFRHPGSGACGDWAERALRLVEGSASVEERALTAGTLVIHYAFLGRLGEAAIALARARPPGRAALREPVVQLTLHLAETLYAWVRGDAAACAAVVDEGLALARSTGIMVWTPHLGSLGVASALASGDLARARFLLDGMAAASPMGGNFARGNYHFYVGWEAMLRGDLAHALTSAHLALEGGDACDYPYARAYGRIACALALRAAGRSEEARRRIDELAGLADAIGSDLVRYSCLLTAADCALRDGDDLTLRALAEGIERDYARALVKKWRVHPEEPPLQLDGWPWPIELRTLGRFEVRRDGALLSSPKKAQETPLRLLRALVALGAGGVASRDLIEALWPDADGDTGRRVLDTTLHRLRKLLDVEDAATMSEGRVRLDPRRVWIDVAAFEHLLERRPEAAPAERLFALYRQPFLVDSDEPWTLPPRERLHGKFLRAVQALGGALEARGELERASEVYARALEIDDLAEALYRALMRCAAALGRESEALRVYQRCQRVLRSRLGAGPSSETEQLRAHIRRPAPAR